MPQSIVVSGVWGYCIAIYDDATPTPNLISGIPDDAWKAIRDLAAANCLQAFREGLLRGVVEWKQADRQQRYGEEMLEKLGDGLRARAYRTLLAGYRLLSY
jgi:hypothetical protein